MIISGGDLRRRLVGVGMIFSFALAPNSHADVAEFSTLKSPGFTAAQSQQLSGIFTSCGGINNSLDKVADLVGSKLTKKKSFGPVSINTVCPTTDEGVTDSLSCENISSKASWVARDDAALLGFDCQKKKIAAIQGELSCLSKEAGALSQKVGAVGDLYSKNMTRMEKDVQTMDAAIADRVAQVQSVNERLGPGKAGEPGLLKIQEQMTAVVRGMPAFITSIKEQQTASAKQRVQLEEWIQVRKMALASQCLQTKSNAGWQCTPNGPQVSAIEYVKCRVRENSKLGRNNTNIEQDELSKKRAAAKESGIDGILADMLSNMPSSSQIPTTAQELTAIMGSAKLMMNPKDLDARYGGALSGLSVKGVDARGFIMGVFNQCYNDSLAQVSAERASTSSSIGQNIERINVAERATSTQVNTQIGDYSKLYVDATKALTGQHMPLNTSACDTGTPAVQAKCLDDIYKNMKNLSEGKTETSKFVETIKGTDPKTNIVFTCYGVDGCVTSLQAVARNVEGERKKVETAKTSYIQTSNQNVAAFTKQLAQKMSIESQQLADRQTALNSALASVGLTGLSQKTVKGEELQIDPKTGLYRQPKSVLGLIGSQMNPAMLDVSPDTYSGTLSSISSQAKETDSRIAKIQAAEADWDKTEKSCKKADVAEYKTAVADYENECKNFDKFEENDSTLANLLKDVQVPLAKFGSKTSGSSKRGGKLGPDSMECKRSLEVDDNGNKGADWKALETANLAVSIAANGGSEIAQLDAINKQTAAQTKLDNDTAACESSKASYDDLMGKCDGIYSEALGKGNSLNAKYDRATGGNGKDVQPGH